MPNSAVTGFDITLWCVVNDTEQVLTETVQKFLQRIAKCWCFQKERTQSGRLHYQIRLRLREKRRETPFIRFCHDNEEGIPKQAFGKISITSSTTHSTSDFNYVMKEDSRVEGPWRDTAPLKRKTRQLRELEGKELYEWQKKLLHIVDTHDDRHIHVILDVLGNSGKSAMAEYLEYHKDCEELPPLNDTTKLMQIVMCMRKAAWYVSDMPRGLKKDKLSGYYAGVECIKNGFAFDERYSFRKERFDRPGMVIFTNQLPDCSLLTPDRWQIHRITEDKKLVKVNLPHNWVDEEGKPIPVYDVMQGKYDPIIPRMGIQPSAGHIGIRAGYRRPVRAPDQGAGADTSSQQSLGSIPSMSDGEIELLTSLDI